MVCEKLVSGKTNKNKNSINEKTNKAFKEFLFILLSLAQETCMSKRRKRNGFKGECVECRKGN
jgi:hypothetical protein